MALSTFELWALEHGVAYITTHCFGMWLCALELKVQSFGVCLFALELQSLKLNSRSQALEDEPRNCVS